MKALVVDDNGPSLKLIKGILEHEGIEVISHSNVADAIEAVAEQNIQNIDVVITDIIMPETSGVDLIR